MKLDNLKKDIEYIKPEYKVNIVSPFDDPNAILIHDAPQEKGFWTIARWLVLAIVLLVALLLFCP